MGSTPEPIQPPSMGTAAFILSALAAAGMRDEPQRPPGLPFRSARERRAERAKKRAARKERRARRS
jgi:hypothetical protein